MGGTTNSGRTWGSRSQDMQESTAEGKEFASGALSVVRSARYVGSGTSRVCQGTRKRRARCYAVGMSSHLLSTRKSVKSGILKYKPWYAWYA